MNKRALDWFAEQHALDISVQCPACKAHRESECVGLEPRRDLNTDGSVSVRPIVHFGRRVRRLVMQRRGELPGVLS